MNDSTAKPLRSQEWFGRTDKDGFIHRSWMKNQGLPHHVFDGRPAIGICNTFSELTPCNAHFRELAEYVKRGVWEAGGVPFEFPVMSLGETNLRPTAMLFRNLASMDVEESIRANPIDGVILLAGCDKTTPALLMGAASLQPAVADGVGRADAARALQGPHDRLGHRRLADERGGARRQDEARGFRRSRERDEPLARPLHDDGHRLDDGLAWSRRSASASPATPRSRRWIRVARCSRTWPAAASSRWCARTSRWTASSRATRSPTPFAQTPRSAARRNAVVHLLALAGRIGVDLKLEDWELGSDVPCLVDLQPSGQFLMEDFYYAGGVPVVLRELGDNGLLHKDALTVNGKRIWENVKDAECTDRNVITAFAKPFKPRAGIAVLRGNLAPNGAVIKPSAATESLLKHRGRAVVFENVEELHARIDDETLDVDETCVLVLKGAGPKGYPGFAEVGNMPLPAKVLKKGITDMVRISDGRMSGTAYGAVVLHVSPEAAAGGPLALVRNGDMIELDVAARKLHLEVGDEELARRRAAWSPPEPAMRGGYQRLYVDHVMQADRGADLDFLVGCRGAAVPRESH